MAEFNWIKLSVDIFTNDKIRIIERLHKEEKDSLIIIWLKLLCKAGEKNTSGVLTFTKNTPYTIEMLSEIFNRPAEVVQFALKVFEEFEMIEIVDGAIIILNWEKYQSLDKMEELKEKNRQRVAKHREKQRQIACNVTSNVTSNVTVTQCNALDKIREEEIREDKKRGEENRINGENKNFPPLTHSPAQIEDYIRINNLNVDAEKFFNYYNERNWKTKNGNPVEWEKKLMEWHKNETESPKNQKKSNKGITNPFLELTHN